MQCPRCGFENQPEMHFCIQCATPLTHACPQCAFENPSPVKFCGKCATPLSRASGT
jgi:predicted amidophosphoribosyltransferase